MPNIATQRIYHQVQGDCKEYRKFLGSSRIADHNEVESIYDSFVMSFSENLSKCDYYDLNSKLVTQSNSQIFMIHVNIQSLQKNFNSLHETINTLSLNQI